MNHIDLITLWFALVSGNFLYQFFRGGYYGDYRIAADRSYFQGIALVLVYLFYRVREAHL